MRPLTLKLSENVRLIMSGGAPLPLSLVRQYHEAGIVLQQGFGMSEAAPSISTLPKDLALKKAGSIGRALFHLEARVVDENMKDVPPNGVGELVYSRAECDERILESPRCYPEGFLRRLGFIPETWHGMDEEGDLYIVDRKKDMFISGGENVYPRSGELRFLNSLKWQRPLSSVSRMNDGERQGEPLSPSNQGRRSAKQRCSIPEGTAG